MPDPHLPHTETQRPRARLLLIEDDERLRTSTAKLLRYAGYAVDTAADGATAVELATTHRGEFPVAIIDLTMPHMDGLETLEALRAVDPRVQAIVKHFHDAGKPIFTICHGVQILMAVPGVLKVHSV